jgi:hypothetical protein
MNQDSVVCKDLLRLWNQDRKIEILEYEINPSDYSDASCFRRDYLAVSMMSKVPFWELDGVDRAGKALEKFRQSEVDCAATNQKFEAGPGQFSGLASGVILTAARKISRLLGELDWNTVAECFDWGPGASTVHRRRYADSYYKFGSKTEASYNLTPLIPALKSWFQPLWSPDVTLVSGGKGTTVPKKATVDRFIMIEPPLNSLVQKGLGGAMRRALRKIGLLTPDAQELNAEAARLGSIDGKIATIDLSGASDGIAMQLIVALLPQDWVSAIEICRSPNCLLPDGSSVELQKVSSMGNGFTFELETLVFWALCTSYVSIMGGSTSDIRVYGDDIIMPSEHAEGFSKVLLELGFRVNPDKSFWTGPFRESCGKHYFLGVDVTPFYVRDRVARIDRYYWLANSWLMWGLSDSSSIGQLLRDDIVSKLPLAFRTIPIPLQAGSDTGLYMDLDEAVMFDVSRARIGWEGWRYPYLKRLSRVADGELRAPSRLAKAIHSLERVNGTGQPDLMSGSWEGRVGFDEILTIMPLKFRGVITSSRRARKGNISPSAVTRPLWEWRLCDGKRRALVQQWLGPNSF